MHARARTAVVAVVALVAAAFLAPPAQADRAVDPGGNKVFTQIGNETVVYGGFVYFAADDGVRGTELWRTDGTPGGTTLVKDFNVGNAHSRSNPHELTVVGNRLFVRTSTPVGLWVFDSPSSAPKAITYSGTGDAAALSTLVAVGSSLIGIGYTHAVGRHTWFRVASGSTSAAVIRADVNTTAHPNRPVVFGNHAYFGAMDTNLGGSSQYGYELWRTDGTAAGTTLVHNIAAGSGSSNPGYFTKTSNRIYFVADDGFKGRELWTSDGTAAGTRNVRDHRPGTTHAQVTVTTSVGNVLYYLVDDYRTGVELWRTDGTAAGTRVVKDIDPGVTGGGVGELVAVGGTVYYLRGYHNLWATNGTAAGTRHLKAFDSAAYNLTSAFGKLYLEAGQHPWSTVLWRSSGTPATTFPIATGGFSKHVPGQFPIVSNITALGSRLIYTSRFAQSAGSRYGAADRKIYYLDTRQADLRLTATKAPTVTGTKRPGNRLTVKTGTWSPAPLRFEVQWYAGSKAIKGATGTTLNVTDALLGKKVSARVTAHAIGAAPRTVATKKVAITGRLTVTKKAAVKGTARVGKTLTAVKPKFAQKGVKLSYQWYAGSKKIAKAKKAKLKLTAKHRGKKISVRVTATKKHFTKITVKSPKTKKVAGR